MRIEMNGSMFNSELDQEAIQKAVTEEYILIKKRENNMREAKNPCDYCPLKKACFSNYTDVRNQCSSYAIFIGEK